MRGAGAVIRGDSGGARPKLAALIVNYRTADLTIDCIRSLADERADVPDLHVMVVDGASGDGSAERIGAAIAADGFADFATLVPLPVNGGFGYANNQALFALRARGPLPDYIVLINPDARSTRGALATLAGLLDAEPGAGAVGALLIHEDGTPQGSAFTFPSILGEFCRSARTDVLRRLLRQPKTVVTSDRACRVPWVTGAAVMFRTAALEQVGLFDDGFFLYFEETELMVRLARAGWTIWHEPAARIIHLGGKATQLRDTVTGRLSAKRLPRYWYEARRRYFVRTRGRAGAVAAGLAWLAGRGVWQARCLLTRRQDDDPARSTRDFLAYGLWPRRRDRRATMLPDLAGAPGQLPAWMTADAAP